MMLVDFQCKTEALWSYMRIRDDAFCQALQQNSVKVPKFLDFPRVLYDEMIEVQKDAGDTRIQSESCKSSSTEEFIPEEEEKEETEVEVDQQSPLEKVKVATSKAKIATARKAATLKVTTTTPSKEIDQEKEIDQLI